MRRRAAAYCRVSTESAEQLASLKEQEGFFADYAKGAGLTLVHIYADSGTSGTRLANRSAFAQMMADARRGAFDLLLVKDISRMARNVLDFLQTVRTLKKLGIECRFVTANCSAGEGELFLTILAAVAQEESANLSKRVKFTKDYHARLGRVPSRVYGYRREKGDLFRLTIDEAESEVVRRIYDYAAAGWGSRRIACLLQAEGHLTRTGRLFGESSVRKILDNPLYAGILRTHQTEVTDYLTGERCRIPIAQQYTFLRPELAIVSKKLWQEVADKRRNRQKTERVSGGNVLVCSACHKPFRRRQVATDTVWSCATRSRLGVDACLNQTRIRDSVLAETLYAWLDAYVTPSRWQTAKEMAEMRADDGMSRRQRRELRKKQEVLYLSGAIGEAEYRRRILLLSMAAGKAGEDASGTGRERVLRRMVSTEVRRLWIERAEVGCDGRVVIFLLPPMRKQSMLPDWETP